jgi:hypothetical protein
MARSPLPLAAIALVALIGAGCANAPAESGSGRGGGGNAAGDENAAAEAGPNPERKGKLSEFAKCMRENGVEDFPDPDDEGIIRYHGGTDRPEFESARENCRVVLPEGLGAEDRAPGGGG